VFFGLVLIFSSDDTELTQVVAQTRQRALVQKSGQVVVFVARGKQLQALRERGLTVRTPDGDSHD